MIAPLPFPTKTAARGMFFSLAVALVLPSMACAESLGSGRYESADAAASFSHVIAYRLTEDGAQSTELVFAEKPLDSAAILRGVNARGDESTTSVLWQTVDGAFLRVRIDGEGGSDLYTYIPPGYNFNYGGSNNLTLKVNTPSRIEGSFDLADTDMDGKPRKIALTFSADVLASDATPEGTPPQDTNAGTEAPTAQTGTALPADGGEPGKVLLRAVAAQRAGDFDGMVAVSTKAQREKMLGERGKPETAAMIEMMKAMASSSITIHGGHVDGDTATVDFSGHYDDGGTSKGIATLRQEEGHWAVEHIEESR